MGGGVTQYPCEGIPIFNCTAQLRMVKKCQTNQYSKSPLHCVYFIPIPIPKIPCSVHVKEGLVLR